MAVSHREVVRELKEGDRVGCSHLMDLYHDRLIGDAIRLFGIPAVEAEELVSDVLLAVVHHIHTFEFRQSERDFHLWVVAIFRNRIRDHVRKAALRLHVVRSLYEQDAPDTRYERMHTDLSQVPLHGAADALCDVYEIEERKRGPRDVKLEIITDVLDALQPWERTLLCCRAADVPYDEIAQYTGKPAGTLKVYHGRVKKRFVARVLRRFAEHDAPLSRPAAGVDACSCGISPTSIVEE